MAPSRVAAALLAILALAQAVPGPPSQPPGLFLVYVSDSGGLAEAAGLIEDHGGRVASVLSNIKALIAYLDPSVADDLSRHPSILWVARGDRVYAAQLQAVQQPPSPVPVSAWHVGMVRADLAWKLGLNGSGVVVALIDTGLDPGALAGLQLAGWAEAGRNGSIDCSGFPSDDAGHGTMVAGVLLSIAPAVRVAAVKALDAGGGTLAQVAAAIDWALGPACSSADFSRADVILLSLAVIDYYGPDLLPAIARALEAGSLVVAAAGNWGHGRVGYPANVWGVVAVGALDGHGIPAYFSGGGRVEWPDPPDRWPFNGTYPRIYTKPDLAAPGVGVPTVAPQGRPAALTGTSAAAPIVAGAAAIVFQAFRASGVEPGPVEVYAALARGAKDAWKPGPDERTGWGLVDAYASVMEALEASGAPGLVVLDSTTMDPVAWATVDPGSGPLPAREGVIRVPPGLSGRLVEVKAWGYEPVKARVPESGYAVVTLDRLPHGLVSGRVTSGDGAPVHGAVVAVKGGPAVARSGPDGYFEAWLPAGRHVVVVHAPGYGVYKEEVVVEPGSLVRVDAALYGGPRLALIGPSGFLDGVEYAIKSVDPSVVVVRAESLDEIEDPASVDVVVVSPGFGLLSPEEAVEELIDYAVRTGALIALPVTPASPLASGVLRALGVEAEAATAPAPAKVKPHPALEGLEGAVVPQGAPGLRVEAPREPRVEVSLLASSGAVAAALEVRSPEINVIAVSYRILEDPAVLASLASYAAGPRPSQPLGSYTSTQGGSVIVEAPGGCVGWASVSGYRAEAEPLAGGLALLGPLPGLPEGSWVATLRGCGGETLAWYTINYRPSTRIDPARAPGGSTVTLTLRAHPPGLYKVVVDDSVAAVVQVGPKGYAVVVIEAPRYPGLYRIDVVGRGGERVTHTWLLVEPAGALRVGLRPENDPLTPDGLVLVRVLVEYAGGPGREAFVSAGAACAQLVAGPLEAGPGEYAVLLLASSSCKPKVVVQAILWPLEASDVIHLSRSVVEGYKSWQPTIKLARPPPRPAPNA